MKKISRRSFLKVASAATLGAGAASLTACGGASEATSTSGAASSEVSSIFNETGMPIVNEPVEFNIFYCPPSTLTSRPIAEKEFFNKMAEETGVTINWTEVSYSAAPEKLNIILASGDLPDAIISSTVIKPMLPGAIEAGQIMCIDDLVQYMPNTQKIFEVYPEAAKAASYTGDGKKYYFPGVELADYSRVGNPMFINRKWLDAVGMDAPTTVDELLAVCEAFKTMDPNGNGKNDEIPMGMCKTWFGMEAYRLYPLFNMVPAITSPIDATIRDGVLEYNPTSENFKLFVQFLSTCYSKGYIEAESLTQDNTTYAAKATTPDGTYGFLFAWLPEMTVGTEIADQYELLLPLKGPCGEAMFNGWTGKKPASVAAAMTLTTACKHPEILARWFDHTMDGTNPIEIYSGAEGTGWILDEENKSWSSNDDELKEMGLSFDDYRIDYALQMTFGTLSPEIIGYERVEPESSSVNVKTAWSEAYDPYCLEEKDMWPFAPPIDAETPEAQEVAIWHAELKSYVDTFVADVMIGGYTDEKWEAHVQACKSHKCEEVVAYYQGLLEMYQ